MSGYPTLVEFVFRFFTHRKRTGAAGEQRNVASSDVSAEFGGAQPVCRLLDNSEDIADSYSRPSSQRAGNLRQKGEQIVATPAPESNLLTFTCDTTNETFCGEFVCEEPALGICKHCNQFVCKRCLKSGYCYVSDHHEDRGKPAMTGEGLFPGIGIGVILGAAGVILVLSFYFSVKQAKEIAADEHLVAAMRKKGW
jgi:hypothetical protein